MYAFVEKSLKGGWHSMSGCFLAKYLRFLIFRYRKTIKTGPKSDILCQGQIGVYTVCCLRGKQKPDRELAWKWRPRFSLRICVFCASEDENRPKSAKNSSAGDVVKWENSLYAVPVPEESGIQVKQQSHRITEDPKAVGDDLQKIFDRSIHTLPLRDAAL